MNKENNNLIDNTKIALFKGKQIRKTLYQGEWWFSVVDVVKALTDSDRPSVYWTAMKVRVKDEGNFQLSTICRQLKMQDKERGGEIVTFCHGLNSKDSDGKKKLK